jgi:butyryl-CoA dehydrogenase
MRAFSKPMSCAKRMTRSSNNVFIKTQSYTNWPFLSEEHCIVADSCKSFAAAELAPYASKVDKEHWFPENAVKMLGEMGMMGMQVPAEFGGAGMDALSYAIAMEEISRGCASAGVIMSANNSLYCAPVEKYGSTDQKTRFLTPW